MSVTMRDMDEGLAELGRNVAELALNELRIEAISTAIHHMAKRGLASMKHWRKANECLEETNRRLAAWEAKQARA
jgi:hypothetical protein